MNSLCCISLWPSQDVEYEAVAIESHAKYDVIAAAMSLDQIRAETEVGNVLRIEAQKKLIQ